MSFFDSILWPIMLVVAWIMVQFHKLFTWLGMPADSGAAWVLSIAGLVIVIRIVLIPLFVKQIKASRGLQLIQPQMQKIQAKYKGKTDTASRQAMQQEMMALYKDAGTNPFSSCLPILAQSPVFFALFRVLYTLPEIAAGTMPGRTSIGPLTAELAASAEQSTVFGAPLSSTFMRASEFGAAAGGVRFVSVVLIILMSATTFWTQRQLTMKNMPAAALDNPIARQQKMLMYLLPIIFAVTGVNFPIGVLVYWFTTNLWTMGQQFYVIRRMPAPGSAAEAALKARRAKRAMRRGRPVPTDAVPADEPVEDAKPAGQRTQPKRKDRQRAPQPRPSGTTDSGAQEQRTGTARPGGAAGVAGAAGAAGTTGKRTGGPAKGAPARAGGPRADGSQRAGSSRSVQDAGTRAGQGTSGPRPSGKGSAGQGSAGQGSAGQGSAGRGSSEQGAQGGTGRRRPTRAATTADAANPGRKRKAPSGGQGSGAARPGQPASGGAGDQKPRGGSNARSKPGATRPVERDGARPPQRAGDGAPGEG